MNAEEEEAREITAFFYRIEFSLIVCARLLVIRTSYVARRPQNVAKYKYR